MAASPTVTSLKVRDEVASLKRERTVEAAADLFYERGYDNSTLDAVAERLGVTKPFIYANFGSKTELLAEICARGVMAADEAIESVLALDLAPIPSLELFGKRYVTAVLTSQKYIAVYTREEKNLDPADAKRIGEMRRQFFRKITLLLDAGRRSGDFGITDSRMAALAIGGAVSWATFWFRAQGPMTIAEIAESLTRSILGIAHVRAAAAEGAAPVAAAPRRRRAPA